jgi:hypothetical protein
MTEFRAPWSDQTEDESGMMSPEEIKAMSAALKAEGKYPVKMTPLEQTQVDRLRRHHPTLTLDEALSAIREI